MSDSGREEATSRRRRKEGLDAGTQNWRSRQSYSDESGDAQPRRRDRSPHQRPGRRRGDDDYDKGRSRRDTRDRRDQKPERTDVKDTRKGQDYRTRSESQDGSRHHRRSRSPPAKRRRRSDSTSQSPPPSQPPDRRSRAPLPSQAETFRSDQPITTADGAAVEKQKPNYKPTGLLAKEANRVAGTTTVLKYHEPPEARKPPPSQQWRIYVFKGKDLLDTIHLHTRSAWLLGRDEKVTDYHIEHPSASKQHAVIQFRYISKTDEFGTKTGKVKPYLIDLDSAHGTKLNGRKIAASRYVEVMHDDVVAFGESEREYVVMLPEAEKKK